MNMQPVMMTSKAREAHSAIKRILLTDWDPVDVASFPESEDEYDAYVSEVYKLLSRRAHVQEIFDYLWWLETKHMSLCGDRQRTEAVADKLAALITEGILPGTEPSASVIAVRHLCLERPGT
jgi:hypothetical protein